MRPRRTATSNAVYRLAGGNEDNDLWVERTRDASGNPVLISVWQLTLTERIAIADRATIELYVWGTGTPPVALGIGPSLQDRREATA